MKQLLLGTTMLFGAVAIAGVVHAQQPLTVSVGGYVHFDAGFVSEDEAATTDDARGHDFRTSTEVHIKAEGTTDAGLVYGAVVELEGDQNPGQNNGDETHMYVSGGWGRVELGDKEGPANVSGLSVTAPGGFGIGGVVANNESYRDLISNDPREVFGDTGGDTAIENDLNDIAFLSSLYQGQNGNTNTKISYYSPKFSGFQVGVAYTPDTANTGNLFNRQNFSTGATPDANENAVRNVHEMIEAAVKFEHTFANNVGLALSATHTRAEQQNIAANADALHEDLRSFAFGAQVNYMGFTAGGSYVTLGDSYIVETAANDDSTKAFTLGLQYETGPFVVGINYINAEAEGETTAARSGDVEYDAYSIGGTYNVAPGLMTYAEATFFDLEGDDAAAVTDDNDGSVFLLGTRVTF